MTLYPGSYQIDPMRYATKPSQTIIEQAWSSGEWLAQEKKDGSFYQLEKTDAGNVYMFGRTVSKKTGEYTEKSDNFPHIKAWAEEYLPDGTILIGEIYIPGGKSNDVTKISGCLPANAYKRQFESSEYGGPVHYYIFDCIRYEKINYMEAPTIVRYNQLCNLEEALSYSEYVEVAKNYYDNFEQHLKDIFATGGEGMVFKKKDCPYRVGKRTTTSQMFKYKEHLDSIDLICMELLDPVKEYTGKELETWPYWIIEYKRLETDTWAYFHRSDKDEKICGARLRKVPVTKPWYFMWKNAIKLGAYKDGKLIEVCRVASGLTDEIREDMANNPENYLDKVIEIECMSINKKDGTVRHPVFKRVREDKGSQDCLYDEIFKEV